MQTVVFYANGHTEKFDCPPIEFLGVINYCDPPQVRYSVFGPILIQCRHKLVVHDVIDDVQCLWEYHT